jgi:hypothetical protein
MREGKETEVIQMTQHMSHTAMFQPEKYTLRLNLTTLCESVLSMLAKNPPSTHLMFRLESSGGHALRRSEYGAGDDSFLHRLLSTSTRTLAARCRTRSRIPGLRSVHQHYLAKVPAPTATSVEQRRFRRQSRLARSHRQMDVP